MRKAKSKEKSKSPWPGFTVKEVFRAEQTSWVIQVSNDFYQKDGELVFSKSEAERHYDRLLRAILTTIEDGNEKQRATAEKCLVRLHLLPLRIS